MPIQIPEIIRLMETESTPFAVIKEVLAMAAEVSSESVILALDSMRTA